MLSGSVESINPLRLYKWNSCEGKSMEKPDACDPYSRPARRTQWIVSTLAYHYGLDRGVENEIIVLATGLDQYLQEIFHHLDCQGDGKIPAEDFSILCEILGLSKGCDLEECAGILDNLPKEFTFRQFHAKLCGYFSTKAGCQYENGRLLVGKESEHIETQIRLRSPLRRRGKLLSLGTSNNRESEKCSSPTEDRHTSGCKQLGSCTRACYEEIVALEEAEDRISKLEEENASLRELVEDMRAALQSSDARSLALQVGLWKSHSKHKPEGGCFIAHQRRLAQKPNTVGNLKDIQSFLREMDFIRSSRDGQIEEAMFFNQKLEQELQVSRKTALVLEECNRTLKKEQVEMRKRVEEARQAVLSGLKKVKELESKASHVPVLQRHVQQLEMELLFYRSEGSKTSVPFINKQDGQYNGPVPAAPRCCIDAEQDRHSPTGRAETLPDTMEEQLFRSVEGQAASDEEEERWTGEQQRQVDEVKRILTRLSCCGDRCDEKAVKKLLSHFGDSRTEESQSAVLDLLEKVTRLNKQLELKESQARRPEINTEDQMRDALAQELQQKAEETELLHMELQMLETERVRLSLVEEKLMDVLQLLQQLRELNVSRRSLGKILLSTLESCSDPQHGKAHILEVLNALCHELAACEILSGGETIESAQSHQSLTNSLLISC
ncbi:EF-hand and coiled-coil domain-containing protein 1 [Triplophysa rosa]|uniref:EF-hand and coiled-coil domain-containing protein 1 n=1 Tax=Triplophysa rosa TaxID=992332 RepID=A0A9W7TEA0_TRIRA|nr:EF-hand and coiled-coil domain-containing protein 1 [Triplophysa rosa]KAI7795161.1 putative EF-hand and coiled-coil domain-containing protein 1 [Triplophysa rosa]